MQALPDLMRRELGTDEAIVQRIVAGERELYEVLVRRNNQRLFRAARSILRDNAEAEDVMQEAYLRAFAALATFRAESKFSTWLTRITVHEALARKRRTKLLEPIEEDSLQEALMSQQRSITSSPEQAASERELAAWLEVALDTLPEAYRAVFVLRAVEEMSVAETAECLDVPPDTVKTRLFRARALLQRTLERDTNSRVHAFMGARCDRITNAVMSRVPQSPE